MSIKNEPINLSLRRQSIIIPEHDSLPKIQIKEALCAWNSFMEKSGIRKFCSVCKGNCCTNSKGKLFCGLKSVNHTRCKNSIACVTYLCSYFDKYIPKDLKYIRARFADTRLYGRVSKENSLVTDYSNILKDLQKQDWNKILKEPE